MKAPRQGKLRNSMNLAKLSYTVLRKDKELLAMPLLEVVGTSIIVAAIATAIALNPSLAENESTTRLTSLLAGLILTVSLTCLTKFLQGALVAAAYDRMTGGDPHIISALGAALKLAAQLIGLGLVAGVLKYLIALIRRTDSRLVRLAALGAELAWEYATYLSVPAIVINSKGPIESIKHSARLLRRTWGEQITARIGFGLLSFLFMIPGLVIIGLGLYIVGSQSTIEQTFEWSSTETISGLPLIAVGALWSLAVPLVFYVLGIIYKTALYVYATTGVIPAGFEEAELERAFIPKS